jgi:hypothetical protein
LDTEEGGTLEQHNLKSGAAEEELLSSTALRIKGRTAHLIRYVVSQVIKERRRNPTQAICEQDLVA